MKTITQELTHSLFVYRDGSLYWRETRGGVAAGAQAGGRCSDGYIRVRVNGRKVSAHRVIFLMFYGYLPKEVDHKDLNKSNNRIDNLRAATTAQNASNKAIKRTNISGVKGVCWYKKYGVWRVQICVNRKVKHLGYFEDFELADLVATEARAKYHGEFARHA
jgi:hypothetical protein